MLLTTKHHKLKASQRGNLRKQNTSGFDTEAYGGFETDTTSFDEEAQPTQSRNKE